LASSQFRPLLLPLLALLKPLLLLPASLLL
jgi:hypothetical protein